MKKRSNYLKALGEENGEKDERREREEDESMRGIELER